MKTGVLLFRLTAGVVFVELLLGGLLTFSFISAAPHIIVGFAVLILAIITMVVSIVSKPPFRPMQGLSTVMVALIVLQIVLGFVTLGNGSSVVALIHFVNAMAIYGASISGTFLAMRWNAMAKGIVGKTTEDSLRVS